MREWVFHQACVLRMLVYAGGSSIVSVSPFSAGEEGPASSCCITLTGRKDRGMGDFLLVPVPVGDATRWGSVTYVNDWETGRSDLSSVVLGRGEPVRSVGSDAVKGSGS